MRHNKYTMKILNLWAVLALISCSRIQTLNTEKHLYSSKPDHIIWFQIPGLTENHLPLIKYNGQLAEHKSAFESFDCVGKMLTFNLYQLRPDAGKSFLSQLLGSKNIKNNCEDYDRPFFWRNYLNQGYKVSIIEKGMDATNSIEKYAQCGEMSKADFNNIRLWKMSSNPYGKNYFHYQDKIENIKSYLNDGIYFDRSCNQEACYSTLSNNVKTLYGQLLKENQTSIMIVRDFSYLNAIKNKNLSQARELLQEYDSLLKWSFELPVQGNSLVLVTSGEVTEIEFPKEGREWEEFMKVGKNATFKNTNLISTVMARGSMAENFCGVFEEFDIERRLLFKQPKKVFNWDNINPFNN